MLISLSTKSVQSDEIVPREELSLCQVTTTLQTGMSVAKLTLSEIGLILTHLTWPSELRSLRPCWRARLTESLQQTSSWSQTWQEPPPRLYHIHFDPKVWQCLAAGWVGTSARRLFCETRCHRYRRTWHLRVREWYRFKLKLFQVMLESANLFETIHFLLPFFFVVCEELFEPIWERGFPSRSQSSARRLRGLK